MTPNIILEEKTILGGKGASGVCHHIINQIPEHTIYIEGFLGLGRVLRYKKPAIRNVGIDMDSHILDLWNKAEYKDMNLEVLYNSFFSLANMKELQQKDCFLYLDPPYPISTRKSSNKYKHELSDKQHYNLLQIAKGLGCMVAISTYDNYLYQQELKDWRKIQFQAKTRGGVATETLYMNYKQPLPSQLHDTRFVGGNFRQREKTKRRLETIKGKIARLEPFEVARLVDELYQEFDFLK